MNLYIINDVLNDFTSGMAVIAAETQEEARKIFVEEFFNCAITGEREFDSSAQDGKIKCLPLSPEGNVQAGLVSHVWGGD